MYLTNTFSVDFDKRVRSRGRAYYDNRLVDIIEGGKDLVRAIVNGSRAYDVAMRIDGRDLLVGCTCPYYDNDLCKHIWAVLVAAERKGYLTGTGRPPFRLVMSDPDLDEDDEDLPAEYEDIDSSSRFRPDQPTFREPSSFSSPVERKSPPPRPLWEQQLNIIQHSMSVVPDHKKWPSTRELFYIVDGLKGFSDKPIEISLAYREMKRNGEWGKLRTTGMPSVRVIELPEVDRQIVAQLMGGRDTYYSYGPSIVSQRYKLFNPLDHTLMPFICATGRCMLLAPTMKMQGSYPVYKEEMLPVEWDDGIPWEFWLEVRRDDSANNLSTIGYLQQGEQRMELSTPLFVTPTLVFANGRVSRLNDFGAYAWISFLRDQGSLTVPVDKGDELIQRIHELSGVPKLNLPEEFEYEPISVVPKPRLKFLKEPGPWQSERVGAELSFDYDGLVVGAKNGKKVLFQTDKRVMIMRDHSAERAAEDQLKRIGFAEYYAQYGEPPKLSLSANKMPMVVRNLVNEGWHVEGEGNVYRQAREFDISVSSGIDWFELHGTIDFGDVKAGLPELIAALKRGDDSIVLGDGTFGLLPEEWLKKYGLLAGLGSTKDDHIRFKRSQVGLLDVLLSSQPGTSFDKAYSRARDELQKFNRVSAADPPPSFNGRLREYQRYGLGWLKFLQQFGFGGCLADDMGLGKTVQVLALLESRRIKRTRSLKKEAGKTPSNSRLAPSLVIVPRSLVFNWIQEAARFTPRLRVLDHTGMGRLKTSDHFDNYDLVITTYGTLRRDAIQFKDNNFDYVILDEAQAIKNAKTESAKAARLLQGDYRLAMSGTPIENHLGELWSLFEFLNPGLLGSASVFKLNTQAARNPDEQTRALLSRALRPFILRRTKQQVARDLPAKTEQTIYCELEPVQRKLYDELRDHYRRSLLGLIDREGIKKSKIQILEALLRLRQAACHPALIDKTRSLETSAKLQVLLPQLEEVLEEGHKALVFSQFTSFLAIVRERLEREGLVYEYLDGQTRDRAARVKRFQEEPDCKLFLISLKAGGLGLNLTSAEYVFLLDPWWNPAVEAQAIDRVHRIGQTRQVFAYRLIARDTVEEKVLLLQETKRDLADAIINADNSLIRNLAREDLELLLS